MTKFNFLLIGTSLSFIPTLSLAQCVETTNCETLGYTETSCNGGKGVKCPFGSKWACLTSEEECEKSFCNKYGYTSTCTGTGYAGGTGQTCGGKYAQCNCASGYEWRDNACQPKEILNGAHGDLYYCNGVVMAVKAPEMDFFVFKMNLGSMNYTCAKQAATALPLCYYMTGNGVLPTKEQLLIMHKYKDVLNKLCLEHGGTKLDGYYWSSTPTGKYQGQYPYYYTVSVDSGTVSDSYDYPGLFGGSVRPVKNL